MCRDGALALVGAPVQGEADQVHIALVAVDGAGAGVLTSEERSAIQHEQARSIATDHQVWVAFASFAGSTGEGHTQAAGRSSIWMPDGTRLAMAGRETGAIARATFTPSSQ